VADLMSEVLASVYLGPPGASFWRWSEDDGAITWADGTTIAFRGELEEILARLVPAGLPSLSAVVLLLGACRDGWRHAAGAAFSGLLESLEPEAAPGLRRQVLRAYRALARVDELPPELRRGVDAKAVLIEAALEGAPRRLDSDEARAVVGALGDRVSPAPGGGFFGATVLEELTQDLEALARGLAGLDPGALALRLRTGLDEAPRPADVELPEAERVRRLLTRLLGDPELEGVARLARDLLACVHVPRPILADDEQPIGGVSDITNRGRLDRLLVSELAHDDLTFAVRLAMGEALYLRREAPPARPPARRVVLVDCGIRTWGLPRAYGAAVALALAATATGDTDVAVRRTEGGRLAPADLTRREGVVEQLEALDPTPEPSRALDELVRSVADAEPGAPPPDLFVITVGDVAADPTFGRALAAAAAGPACYLATVDRGGRFRLEAVTTRGRRVLSRARLDLGAVLPRTGRGLPGRALGGLRPDPSLPRLLAQEPFPLLLPQTIPSERCAGHPRHGVVAVARDGRVLHWDDPEARRGARQLTDAAPSAGAPVWLEVDDDGVFRAALAAPSGPPLLLVADLAGRTVHRVALPAEHETPLGGCRVGGILALFFRRRVELVALGTGRRLPPLDLPRGVRWRRGRFLMAPDGWYVLGWDGLRARLERVTGSRGLIAVWALEEAFWGLASDGAFGPLADRAAWRRVTDGDGPASCRGVSRDGRRLIVAFRGDDWRTRHRVDVATGDVALVRGDAGVALEPVLAQARGNLRVRKKFDAVAVFGDQLALVSRRQDVLPFGLDAAGELRFARASGRRADTRRLRAFEPTPGPGGRGFQLEAATWPSGDRAYLDSRGLLHLQRAGGPGPGELTLVLTDHLPVAAWRSSDGAVCGPAAFVGEAPAKQFAPAFAADFLRAFVERLR